MGSDRFLSLVLKWSMPLTSFQSRKLRDACEQHGVRLIIGYGSRIHGVPASTEESDFDLGVVDDQPRWTGERHRLITSALEGVWPDHPLDVVHLNAVDLLLRVEALARGELLYGDLLTFDEYRLLTIRLYKDQEDLRQLEVCLIDKKLDRLTALLNG